MESRPSSLAPTALQPLASRTSSRLLPTPPAPWSGNGGKFFFGEEDPSDNTIDNQVGTVTITPATGAVSGLQDSSGPNGLQTAKVISGTFVVTANGTGNLGSGTVLITNGTKIFFIDEGAGAAATISVVEQ